VAIGGSGPIIASNGKAYVLRLGANGGVTVVDGVTLASYRVDTGPGTPIAFTLGKSGRLYVSFAEPNEVRVIDPSFASPSPAAIVAGRRVPGRPGPIAYSIADKIFVLTDDPAASIVAIHPDTLAMETISVPGRGQGPRAISASGGLIFAGFSDGLVVYNPTSRNLYPFQTAAVVSIYYDGTSSQTYVLDASGLLTMVRSADLLTRATQMPGPSSAVGFVYKTCTAVVAGSAGTSLVASACSDLPLGGIDGQGLWWTQGGAESGWGINIAHQGSKLFATWFTYDAQGRNTWLVMSDGRDAGKNRYEGTLYRTTGPAFGAAFDAARVTRIPVGTLHLFVPSADYAELYATVDGATIRKTLSKQQFAIPMPICFVEGSPGSIPNYQDLWWKSPAGTESGWGLNIAHQGDVLFITWFTYDGEGRPMWLVGSNIAKTGNATYAGTLYRTSGPPLAASPWDPARVSRMPAGTATVTFADNGNGTFAYTVDGVSETKAITRQVFAAPATVCR
jgi:hypothetical protein